jgi:solute carrier family 15 oligopeptide transporter 1
LNLITNLRYKLSIRDKLAKKAQLDDVELKLGGSYVITVTAKNGSDSKNPEDFVVVTHTITAESSLHMFWLFPQYIILTAGEIMFSITGLEFSYSQVSFVV